MPLRKATPKHDATVNKLVTDLKALESIPAIPGWKPNEAAMTEEPAGWWADTDWFQNLTSAEIDTKLGSLPAEQDWVVLPVDYVDELRTTVSTLAFVDHLPPVTDGERLAHTNIQVDSRSSAVDGLARELLAIMVQRTGFSTNHAQNAWDMALAYEKERAKRSAAADRTGGVQ